MKEKSKREKITLVITAFKEPSIGKAIESALKQKVDFDYDVLVSAPDKKTLDLAKTYQKKNKNLKVVQDSGEGKIKALNMILKKSDSDILVLTDGDVFISENSLKEIVDLFKDETIGCVTGRPVPIEDRKTKYGYWANFLFDSAHKWRMNSFLKKDFLECSGYLFAFRKKVLKAIPIHTAEDTIIPYFFWQKRYKIGYADKAEVYVKNVNNWKDWISQKTRTTRGHATIKNYVDIKIAPKAKTLRNEAKGIFDLIMYPKNILEYFWSFQLALARLYMWFLVPYKMKIKKEVNIDNWERVESAR